MIKLFSPNIKYRNSVPASLQQATPLDKPYFPISMRLLRVVSILIQKYHSLLVNISEFIHGSDVREFIVGISCSDILLF